MHNIHSILTKEEKAFIKEHGLEESDFYDARGEIAKVYHDKAKMNNCHFVINLCQYGHRLKTRSGHCIICNPARIRYQKRDSDSGVVYLAKNGKFCKVGMIDGNISINGDLLERREYQLNSEGGYGGVIGWKIIKYWVCKKNAGKIERTAHSILNEYQIVRDYIYSGEYREATEMFLCSLNKAEEAVVLSIKQCGL